MHKIKAQNSSLNAKERIEYLLDPGSFKVISSVSSNASAVIAGSGTVNKRKVFVYAFDKNVYGGSLGKADAAIICSAMDQTAKAGAPVIALNESAGARIQEGIDSLAGYGDIFYRNTLYSGVIPQISVIFGSCAGGGVYSSTLADFVFMTKGSRMFLTGPKLVKAYTGEDLTSDELGGEAVHAESLGTAHFAHSTEQETLDSVKRLLGFLPQCSKQYPPQTQNADNKKQLVPELNDLNLNDYSMKDVIASITDNRDFMEIHKDFAKNVITCFARFNGISTGIIGNQPAENDGTMDIDACVKASRFVRFCDSFNIPLVTLVDVPGYRISREQEHSGIIKHGAKLYYAYSEATVPKITVILKKAFSGTYVSMGSAHLGADSVFSWQGAEFAVMKPEHACEILFAKDKDSSKDDLLKKLNTEYPGGFAGADYAYAQGHIRQIIEREETRICIIEALRKYPSKKKTRYPKKHGNIPL